MKFPIAILFCLFVSHFCFSQDSRFIDKILDYESCRSCYFILLNVESDAYTGKIIIEADDLYNFLEKNKEMDKSESKDYIKYILLNGVLTLKNVSLDKDEYFLNMSNLAGISTTRQAFRIVDESINSDEDEQVKKIVSRGCIAVIKYYFLGKALDSSESSNTTDCHKLIGEQNDGVFQFRKFVTEKQKSYIASKLFEWEIPTYLNHYNDQLVINQNNVKDIKDNKSKGNN